MIFAELEEGVEQGAGYRLRCERVSNCRIHPRDRWSTIAVSDGGLKSDNSICLFSCLLLSRCHISREPDLIINCR
jgi:hypothetical protein